MSEYNKNWNNMMCLDIFAMYADKDELERLNPKAPYNERKSTPLLTWDIYSSHLSDLCAEKRRCMDEKYLMSLQKKFLWEENIKLILNQEYHALILTGVDQTIEWVNKGFVEMTGYPSNFAMGKKPSFLQGNNTSAESKSKIRNQLFRKSNFTEEITNYRKNGEEYLCMVSIYQLKNRHENLTHFLALEQEITR